MFRDRQMLALFMAQFVVSMGTSVIVPILPFFALQLGAGSFEVGVLMSAYSLMLFLASALWGALSDRIGRKRVLVIGMGGLSVATAIISFANALWLLILLRAVAGLMAAAVMPTSYAFVGDATAPEERGKGMGIISAGMGIGFIIGPAIGGALVPLGLGVPFLASAALAALATLIAAIYLHEPKTAHPPATVAAGAPSPAAALLSTLGLAVGISFLISLAESNRQSTLALYANDTFQFGGSEMGFIYMVMGLVYVAFQGLIVGPLIDRLGERRMLLAGLPISALGFVLVLWTWDLMSLTIAVAVQGAGMAFTSTSIPTLISKEAHGSQGAAMGLRSSSQSAGQVLGPLLGGWVYGLAHGLPYVVGAFLMLLTLLFGWLAFEINPRQILPRSHTPKSV